MCFYAFKDSTEELAKRIKRNKTKTILAWKVVTVRRKSRIRIFSRPCDYQPNTVVRSGSRVRSVLESGDKDMSTGIYVYLHRPYRSNIKKGQTVSYKRDLRRIRVRCHVDDLIGANSDMAVFRKVEVLSDRYAR